jgi:hypothetical protein
MATAQPVVELGVQVVVEDLETGTDRRREWKIHPPKLPPYLHPLAHREPPASIDPAVRELEAHAADGRVHVGRGSERRRHAGNRQGCVVEIERAYDARIVLARGSNLDPILLRRVGPHHDGHRIHQSVLVVIRGALGDRMKNVLHLLAFADLDSAAEVLHHEAEVVYVVVDPGGGPGDVAPTDQCLE